MKLESLIKIYNKLDIPILKYLAIKAFKTIGLRYLVVRIDTNYTCNLKCRMCYFSNPEIKRRGPMSLELFNRIAADIFKKVRVLYLSCAAEPFMTKNIIDFIKVGKQYNIPTISFCTNGTLLNESKIQDIVDMGVNEVIISIDGATPETYNKIRKGADFNKVIENVRLIKEIKQKSNTQFPHVRINYLLMKSTINEIEPFFEIIKDCDISSVNFREMLPFKTEDPEYYAKESILDDYGLYDRIVKTINNKSSLLGIKVITSIGCQKQIKKPKYRTFECLFPWFTIFINSKGKYRPCVFHEYVADLSQDSYKNISRMPVMKKMRRDLFMQPKKSCLNICNTKVETNT